MKRRMLVSVMLACLPSVAWADPIMIAGKPVEVVVSEVTERTVRVDFLPLDARGMPVATPASVVLEKFDSVEKMRVRDLKDLMQVYVGNLNVSLTMNPVHLKFERMAGGIKQSLLQELTVKDADGSVVFNTPTPTFGLGEGRQQFDRRGFYYNFQNGQNVLLATHGATLPVPFLIGMGEGGQGGVGGWGMFVHNPPPASAPQPNTAWVEFDLRGGDVPPIAARGRGRGAGAGAGVDTNLTPPEVRPTKGRFIPRQDTLNQAPTSIFIMNLDTPADALVEYTHLVGSAVMPPKWVLGYMQSHRSLQGPEEVLGVAKRLRDDKLSCDAVIYLGTGYTIATQGNQPLGGWNMANGRLDFNPAIFNKPQEMIDKLHALNLKIILHKTNAPANLHGDLNDPDVPPNDMTHVANYWSKPARLDTVTHTTLMNMGIDAWWPDDGDDLAVANRLARIQLYYAGSLKDRPNERPWSLDRNGYAGVAKLGGWNWSGDVASTWATLQAHVPDGVQFSLSCSPWWGTDIGGFNGAAEYSGELYTRWFEFAAFTPLFRSHGRNWHLHTPWGWDEGGPGPQESTLPAAGTDYHNKAVEPACRKALELRYALLPYNYTITREACDTGMPLMRALLLKYPEDATAVSLGDEYLWGPNLLVAPVVEKGAKERRVYLPAGTWFDFATGEKQVGKQWVVKPVELETIPLYVRAGAILPLDPVRQYTAEKVTEPTTLRVYPGADGAFTLYDDDGHSQAYLNGTDAQTQWIKMTWNDAARKLTLEADPRMKQWPAGIVRQFKVQLGGDAARAKAVGFAGQRVEVQM